MYINPAMFCVTWETTRTSGPARGCTADHKVTNVDPTIAARFVDGIRANDATVRNVTVYRQHDGAVVTL